MKHFNVLAKMALLVVAFCMAPQTVAYTGTVNGVTWTYTVSDKKATIENPRQYEALGRVPAISTTTTGAIKIPSSLGGYPVTCIGPRACFGCTGLTSVTIPASVTNIGKSAFAGCSGLMSVIIGNGVASIDSNAFVGCSGLISVTIPDSVTSIGDEAFKSCSGLESAIIGNGVESIGSLAFSGCSSLRSITIGNGVTNIGQDAFYNCTKLTSVSIPESVTEIGSWSFSNCSNLSSVTIPDSVRSIGSSAFRGCSSLRSVTIPDSVTNIGAKAFFGCSNLASVTMGNSLTGFPCEGCSNVVHLVTGNGVTSPSGLPISKNLKSIVIGNGVTNLAGWFSDCTGLESVTIPNSVTSIGYKAFYGCSNLTSVTIPDSVTDIGLGAFAHSGLTNATIPNSVTRIGENRYVDESANTGAFYGCKSLKSVTIPGSVTEMWGRTFGNCTGLESVVIGNGVTSIGRATFEDCCGLTSVSIPESVTEIGNRAFSNCSNLSSVTIPDGVTSIGSMAFYGCSSLRSVTIGNGVTIIGGYAFYGCSELTSVAIPDSVTNIGGCAFCGCSGLTTVTIPDCVTSIGTGAFQFCEKLQSVTIPGSVTSIEGAAFSGCSGLADVWFKGSPPSVRGNLFYGVASGAKGHYTAEHAVEWSAVVGADGKWQGLIFKAPSPPELWVDSAKPMEGIIKLAWTDALAGEGVTYSIYRGEGDERLAAVCVTNGLTGTNWTDKAYWNAEPALKPLNYWVVAEGGGFGVRESKPVQTRRRFGVFVGLSDFKKDIKAGRFPMPAKEAVGLRNLLVENGEMAATNAVLLTNSAASWVGVSNAIAAKAEVLQPGDLFVLYVATHGGYKDGTASLLFYDGGASMSRVFKLLETFNCGTLVIPIFMACHSGAFADYAGGSAELDETSEGFKKFVDAGLAMCRANMPVLASCGAEESSYNPSISSTYSDFGDAFIHEGWQNGHADGEVHGVGYGGGDGDGYVSFGELIRYAKAFARGKSDVLRSSVQWTTEHDDLLRATFAGKVPTGGSHPGVPGKPTGVDADQRETGIATVIRGNAVANATRYWHYVLKAGRSSASNDEGDWECIHYLAGREEHYSRFLLGGTEHYRIRAVNGAGASDFSDSAELNGGIVMDSVQVPVTGPGILKFRWKALNGGGGAGSGGHAAEFSMDHALQAVLDEAEKWENAPDIRLLSNREYLLEWTRTGGYPVRVELLSWKPMQSAAMGETEWYYTDDGGEATVMGGVWEGIVRFPAIVNGLAVTAIGAEAFAGSANLTVLAIPDSVTRVGADAFAGCDNLQTLCVPASWEGTDMLTGTGVPAGCRVVYGDYAFTVKFNANGGTGSMAAQRIPQDVATKLRANAFKRSGYTFLGWSRSKTGKVAYANAASVKNLAAAGGSVTLYAQWAKNKYTVKYNANGGMLPKGKKMAEQTFAYGKAAKLRKNVFTRKDCVFTGWATSKGGKVAYKNAQGVKNLRTDGKTTTLYAKWAKKNYKVAFNANGGKGTMAAQPMTYAKAARLRKNAFKRSGWAFLGWSKTQNGAVAYKNAQAVKNLRTDGKITTLYAKWAKNVYKVAFNANGGTGSMAVQGMQYGTAAQLRKNAFKRAGWSFEGWSTDKAGAVVYKDAQAVKNLRADGGTVTLYAKWKLDRYAIVLDPQGGEGGTAGVTATYRGALPDIVVPERKGCVFEGYFTATNGGGTQYYADSGESVRDWDRTAATTLFAHWSGPVLFVDAANGNDANDGLLWRTAKASIQAAIDAAEDGTRILVADGVYEPISTVDDTLYPEGKELEILSVNGAEATIIDGSTAEKSRVAFLGDVDIATGEPLSLQSVLDGFTLRGGHPTNGFWSTGAGAFGGGLRNCIVTDNWTTGSGGGVAFSLCEECVISRNRSTAWGGGSINCILRNCLLENNEASLYGGGAVGGELETCIVRGNTAGENGGGIYNSNLGNCLVTGNSAVSGGGIGCEPDDLILDCTVTGNFATEAGGGIMGPGIAINSIVWGNSAPEAPDMKDCGAGYVCSPDANPGNGNIADDPLFVDAAAGDFRLRVGSPCIDAGTKAIVAGTKDLGGNARVIGAAVDMGAYEYGAGVAKDAANGQKSARSAGTTLMTEEAGWVVVTASGGGDAFAVVDEDETTAWSPDTADGSWVVLSFADVRNVADVEVAGENLPEGTRILLSEDADGWQEGVPGKAQYVWVLFPAAEELPVLREIRVEEE